MLKKFSDAVFGYPTLLIYSIFKWSRKIDKHKMFLCFLGQESIILVIFIAYLFDSYRTIYGMFVFLATLLIIAPVTFLTAVGFPTSARVWLYMIKGDEEEYNRKYQKQLRAIRRKAGNGKPAAMSAHEHVEEEHVEDLTASDTNNEIENTTTIVTDEEQEQDSAQEVITDISDGHEEEEEVDGELTSDEAQAIGDMFADLANDAVGEDTLDDSSVSDENETTTEDNTDEIQEYNDNDTESVELEEIEFEQDETDTSDLTAGEDVSFNINEEIGEEKSGSKLESFLESLDISDDEDI